MTNCTSNGNTRIHSCSVDRQPLDSIRVEEAICADTCDTCTHCSGRVRFAAGGAFFCLENFHLLLRFQRHILATKLLENTHTPTAITNTNLAALKLMLIVSNETYNIENWFKRNEPRCTFQPTKCHIAVFTANMYYKSFYVENSFMEFLILQIL